MEPLIEVTAAGHGWAVPDQVLVSLALQARAETVGDALRQAAAAVDRLLQVLGEAQVAPADRRTSGLSVEPVWDHTTNREAGHSASYDLRVVVRDLDAAGQLVERAAELVGDELRVRQFALSVSDPAPHEEAARRAAVVSCRAQAEQLASAAGVELGRLVSLRTGGHGVGDVLRSRRMSFSPTAGGPPVEAGEHEITVAVTGTWELAQPAG
jgi:uncharacterized protein YggE